MPLSGPGLGAVERRPKRSNGQLGDHGALVLDGPANVRGRAALRRRGEAGGTEGLLGRRRAGERLLGVGRRERGPGDAGDADTGAGDGTVVGKPQDRADAGRGEVTDPPLELRVAAPDVSAAAWDADLEQDFRGLDRGGE